MKRVLVIVFSLVATSAFAQAFPSRPIRLLVGYAAGGGADALARVLTPKLAEALGQGITVDNRPGAGGTLAGGVLAKAPPDGYTLYFSDASLVTAPAIYRELPFDPIGGLAPVAGVAALPLAFVVHPSVAVTTPQELIGLLRANPGKYSYGTPGIGTLHHLSSELLQKHAALSFIHIPYKGAAPALTDLIGGQIPVAVTSATAALAQAKGGKLRIVGLTSRARLASNPEIATIAEAVPGFEVTNDLFVIAPAGTPAAVIATLEGALKSVLAQKELQAAYLAQGAIVAWSSAEALKARMAKDVTTWKTVAREAGIRPE